MSLKNISIPTASGDLVAVIGPDFGQVFALARPMDNNVGLTKKVMKHPIEDGAEVADHQIIEPVQIEMAVLIGGIQARSVFQQLKTAFKSADVFTVQGKTDSYPSMLMSAMPYKEGTDMFGSTVVLLRFEEVTVSQPRYGTLPPRKVASSANADTVERGNQQAIETKNPSLAFNTGKAVKGFFTKGKE